MDEVLKMIEEVDPADDAKLDEIDFKVEKFLGGKPYYTKTPKYTRSRDALKSIRPKGWYFRIDYTGTIDGLKPIAEARKETVLEVFQSGKQKTEELAELHAIIQAIAYERANPPNHHRP